MIETIADVAYTDYTQLEKIPSDDNLRHRLCVTCWPQGRFEGALVEALCGTIDVQAIQKVTKRPDCGRCDRIKTTGKCPRGHDITTSYFGG